MAGAVAWADGRGGAVGEFALAGLAAFALGWAAALAAAGLARCGLRWTGFAAGAAPSAGGAAADWAAAGWAAPAWPTPGGGGGLALASRAGFDADAIAGAAVVAAGAAVGLIACRAAAAWAT